MEMDGAESGGLSAELRHGVLVLTLHNPPSNALTPGLRGALLAAIQGVGPQDGAECRAIVLTAGGVNFSSALQVEPEPDASGPRLATLCQAVAECPLPVVAALSGLAMGAGAELALAAHARIAAPGCRIAFPEVVLGLCPEAGTTRRLPALIGTAAALRLLLTGRAVGADEALALGVLDGVASGPLLDEAIALAQRLASAVRPQRPAEPTVDCQGAVAAARRAHQRALPAIGRIIDCVEAALLLPPDAAQAFEAVAREDLENTPESLALRAIVRAERRAVRLAPAIAQARPQPLDRLALVGTAPALDILARAAMAQAIPVIWLGSAPEPSAGEGSGLLRRTRDPADLAGVPLQVHALPPDTALLRQMAQGSAVLVLGGATGEMGLGIAPSGRAAELSVLAEESPFAIATAVAGLRRIGLPPILVGHSPMLGQRVTGAGELALRHLARLGVPPRQIAAALQAFGARGPQDLVAPREAPLREMDRATICNRWLGAMANQGLRLLDQGIALRPSDIDLALVAGHGFPRWRCGPMHQADLRGLMVLRHDLRLWAEEDALWSPAPLLDRLIADGQRLSALDG